MSRRPRRRRSEGVEFVDITPATYVDVPGTCRTTTGEFFATDAGKQQAIAVTQSWVEAEQFVIDSRDEAFETVEIRDAVYEALGMWSFPRPNAPCPRGRCRSALRTIRARPTRTTVPPWTPRPRR